MVVIIYFLSDRKSLLYLGRSVFGTRFTLIQLMVLRDAFKKKVNFGTLAQKGGGGQSKVPNVDQY